MTDLAHRLGMSVTAEGVESERQHRHVRELGCDLAQGYLHARLVPGSQIGELLAAGTGSPLRLPASPHARPSRVPVGEGPT